MNEKPPVKSYAGGKPNYCTPVDAVNMTPDRVNETAKREHDMLPKHLSETPAEARAVANSSWVGNVPQP
jgi:hypothetical protein